MIIQTERLILRRFTEADIEWYYHFVQNEELKKRLPSLQVKTVEQARFDLKLFEKGDLVNDYYCVITDKIGNVMGIMIAVSITRETIDVSYFLKKEYRKKGYMHEALENLMSIARKRNPLYRFKFVIDKDNIESFNVVTRFGATVKFKNDKYICYM